MLIREMAVSETPYGRAKQLGVEALATAELLTLALQFPNISTAQTLLAAAGGKLRAINPTSSLLTDRQRRKLEAIKELGRRMSGEQAEDRRHLKSPRDVVALLGPMLEDLMHEEFHIVILDTQHRMQRTLMLSKGTLSQSLVHPREVFAAAIAEYAAAIILVHNHPSGDPHPSVDDKIVTKQLVAAGCLLDIPVHDHVIIGKGRYTSFAEAGLLDNCL
jgi:DNA repair protein RadC